MARALRLVIIVVVAALGVTATLAVSVLLGLPVAPVAVAGFLTSGALAACALVLLLIEGMVTNG